MTQTPDSRDLFRSDRETVLVALGGNALLRVGDSGDWAGQAERARETCAQLMPLVERDANLVVTHGNGPQVGHGLIRHERAAERVPALPLDYVVAETEGLIGYMLQQALLNALMEREIYRYVVTMITQVEVAPDDPAFLEPGKPIGSAMDETAAREMEARHDWTTVEETPGQWRRTVPSPRPIKVIQRHMIRHAAREGNIVMAGGGGGIPIVRKPGDVFRGIEAVIDKDLTSSLLAEEIEADLLVILMPYPQIVRHFGQPGEEPIGEISAAALREIQATGEFAPGSVGPKVDGCLRFVEARQRPAIVTNTECLQAALDGEAGTRIRP